MVGAGGLVVRDGKLLMIRQRRAYGVHWELPGGYYDPGESLEEAAAREVLEETGLAVDVGALVCTMVWERDHDHRRNVLAWFEGMPRDGTEPRPQTDEAIEAAAFLDPTTLDDVHPLEQVVLDRWWPGRERGFHVFAKVDVRADGTQAYAFRQ